MSLGLSISPHGRLLVDGSGGDDGAASADVAPVDGALARRITAAFAESTARGLLHLATAELQTHLPAPFAFARDFGREYLTRLCHTPGVDASADPGPSPSPFPSPLPPPPEHELSATALQAP